MPDYKVILRTGAGLSVLEVSTEEEVDTTDLQRHKMSPGLELVLVGRSAFNVEDVVAIAPEGEVGDLRPVATGTDFQV